MQKRERLQLTLAGESADRVPVAAWRHWPGDDQLAASFAQAVLGFQAAYDWDFIKVEPFSAYMAADYGLLTTRAGHPSGDRAISKHPVTRSLHWTELRVQDPGRGELGKHLAALQLMRDGLPPDVPLVTTIYSPFTQARMLAADNIALRNLRTHPRRLGTGLNIITETLLLFIEELRRIGVEGVFYVVDSADFTLMATQEYAEFGLQHDRRILDALPDSLWLNALEVRSPVPMFEFLGTYPLPVICWDAHTAQPEVEKVRGLVRGVLATGPAAQAQVGLDTPSMIRNVAREMVNQAGGRRFILTAGAAVPVHTPLVNLRALRNAVEISDVV